MEREDVPVVAADMPAWQTRVVAEEAELAERLGKLNVYLANLAGVEVPSGETPLAFILHMEAMVRQRNAMTAYLQALRDRIGLFSRLK